MGHNLLAALQVLGIGMLIILSMIAVIFLLIRFVFPLFQKMTTKKEKNKKDAEPNNEVIENTAAVETAEEDDDELIAVITAAIAASTQRPAKSFRVVNFKRI